MRELWTVAGDRSQFPVNQKFEACVPSRDNTCLICFVFFCRFVDTRVMYAWRVMKNRNERWPKLRNMCTPEELKVRSEEEFCDIESVLLICTIRISIFLRYSWTLERLRTVMLFLLRFKLIFDWNWYNIIPLFLIEWLKFT